MKYIVSLCRKDMDSAMEFSRDSDALDQIRSLIKMAEDGDIICAEVVNE